MMLAANIQAFYAGFLTHMANDSRVPAEIRNEIQCSTEIALQVGAGFFLLQYVNALGIHKKFRYYASGLAMETSGIS